MPRRGGWWRFEKSEVLSGEKLGGGIRGGSLRPEPELEDAMMAVAARTGAERVGGGWRD
jgi:hypothetical protein